MNAQSANQFLRPEFKQEMGGRAADGAKAVAVGRSRSPVYPGSMPPRADSRSAVEQNLEG
jgi:hypothetical protein